MLAPSDLEMGRVEQGLGRVDTPSEHVRRSVLSEWHAGRIDSRSPGMFATSLLPAQAMRWQSPARQEMCRRVPLSVHRVCALASRASIKTVTGRLDLGVASVLKKLSCASHTRSARSWCRSAAPGCQPLKRASECASSATRSGRDGPEPQEIAGGSLRVTVQAQRRSESSGAGAAK